MRCGLDELEVQPGSQDKAWNHPVVRRARGVTKDMLLLMELLFL